MNFSTKPKRILMLVPHEPDLDPRIRWVTEWCSQVGRTDIIGFVWWTTLKPEREYNGTIYVERVNLADYPLPIQKYLQVIHLLFISPIQKFPRVIRSLFTSTIQLFTISPKLALKRLISIPKHLAYILINFLKRLAYKLKRLVYNLKHLAYIVITFPKHQVYVALDRSEPGKKVIDQFRKGMKAIGLRKETSPASQTPEMQEEIAPPPMADTSPQDTASLLSSETIPQYTDIPCADIPQPEIGLLEEASPGSETPEAQGEIALPKIADTSPQDAASQALPETTPQDTDIQSTAVPQPERRHRKPGKLSKSILSFQRFMNTWNVYLKISNVLYMRSRAISILPELIICHDIYALRAAVKLKKLFGCPIIYDSHELWPAADLQALPWERKVTEIVERKLIKHADTVITVTPQIARHLEKIYGIEHVLSVPNAEPLANTNVRKVNKTCTFPLRFLLQGNVSVGRGFDELLYCWSHVEDNRAVLILRCPENQFYQELRQRHASLIRNGRVIIAEPVIESQLIDAASAADVGVIPYGRPSLNHLYACPNKLSQYMQAGLAILHNADEQYVSDVVKQYRCGLNYDPSNPETLRNAVQWFIDNPQELANFKKNASFYAETDFNWKIQSKPYFEAIKNYYGGDPA